MSSVTTKFSDTLIEAATANAPVPGSGNRILFVEDIPLFREPISVILQANGYEVLTASDGHSAFQLVCSHHPDLLLLDLGIPRMDGFAVMRAIREGRHRPDMPIIVLTASADKDFVQRARDLIVQDYLLKGQCTSDQLLQRIKRYLPPVPAGAAE